MHHYRKTIKKYHARRDLQNCPFCKPETLANAVYENEHIYIVPNLTQYDLWELFDVQEHLLVIPKRHAESLGELNAAERAAVMDEIAEYETKGYSIYARGVGFVNRSVLHQHTHLIKTTNKKPRFAFYIRHPYFLIKR